MSVKVNLLPGDIAADAKSARVRNLAIAGAAVVALAMGAVSYLQLGKVADAEDRLVVAEDANRQLQVRIGELQPFAELQARQADAASSVSRSMAREASMAGVLQDLSAVLPPTTELRQLSITRDVQTRVPQPGGPRLVEGRITGTGRVLVGVAPGVERLIRDLDRAAVFENVNVSSAALDEGAFPGSDALTFSIDADLGPEILTRRYITTPGVPQ